MANYKMVVYAMKSEAGIEFVAEYPALKGVSGTGKSEVDAISDLLINAEVNLKARVEAGLSIPEEDLLERTDYSGKLSLRLSTGLHQKVAELSVREGVSINHMIVEAVSMYVAGKSIENVILDRFIGMKDNAGQTTSRFRYDLDSSLDMAKQQSREVSED